MTDLHSPSWSKGKEPRSGAVAVSVEKPGGRPKDMAVGFCWLSCCVGRWKLGCVDERNSTINWQAQGKICQRYGCQFARLFSNIRSDSGWGTEKLKASRWAGGSSNSRKKTRRNAWAQMITDGSTNTSLYVLLW